MYCNYFALGLLRTFRTLIPCLQFIQSSRLTVSIVYRLCVIVYYHAIYNILKYSSFTDMTITCVLFFDALQSEKYQYNLKQAH